MANTGSNEVLKCKWFIKLQVMAGRYYGRFFRGPRSPWKASLGWCVTLLIQLDRLQSSLLFSIWAPLFSYQCGNVRMGSCRFKLPGYTHTQTHTQRHTHACKQKHIPTHTHTHLHAHTSAMSEPNTGLCLRQSDRSVICESPYLTWLLSYVFIAIAGDVAGVFPYWQCALSASPMEAHEELVI